MNPLDTKEGRVTAFGDAYRAIWQALRELEDQLQCSTMLLALWHARRAGRDPGLQQCTLLLGDLWRGGALGLAGVLGWLKLRGFEGFNVDLGQVAWQQLQLLELLVRPGIVPLDAVLKLLRDHMRYTGRVESSAASLRLTEGEGGPVDDMYRLALSRLEDEAERIAAQPRT